MLTSITTVLFGGATYIFQRIDETTCVLPDWIDNYMSCLGYLQGTVV